jgi:hypothetical protein
MKNCDPNVLFVLVPWAFIILVVGLYGCFIFHARKERKRYERSCFNH